MRRAANVDRNQTEIVAALRKAGCTVTSLAAVGNGCPDLLVGRFGRNVLLEVKDGAKSASRTALTPAQALWHAAWRGSVFVVRTVDEALAAVGAKENG